MKYFLLIALVWYATSTEAQVLTVGKTTTSVNGKTSMASYTGTSDSLEGTLDLASGEVSFKLLLETIKTGNGTRDKDMYKVLETSDFPYATFEGKLSDGFDFELEQNQKILVQGTFTIHGVSHPLEVTVDLKPTPEGVLFHSFWPINITDYGIKRPSVFFMKVDDEHRIVIEGVLEKDNEL